MTVYRHQVTIRWSDLDIQNHVNNVTYLEYLQEARVALLLEGDGAAMMNDGVVVVKHQVEYLRPIEYSANPVDVHVWIEDVKAATFTYGYEIWHDGALCARARTICCPFDFAAGRPRRLTADERAFLGTFSPGSLSGDHGSFRALPNARVGANAHVFPLKVRWSDQDWFRHVNNVLFFDFLQEARIRMFEVERPQHVWFIARQDVEYLAPMDFRTEPYYVRGSAASVGNSSMTLVSDIVSSLDEGATVHARSICVVVCADLDGVPTPIPDEYRAQLAEYPAVIL